MSTTTEAQSFFDLGDVQEVVSFLEKMVAILLTGAVFIRASIIEPYRIPSGSMQSTLKIGDQILVNKLSYGIRFPLVRESLFRWTTPKRGDIVVFTRPDETNTLEDESAINLIKGGTWHSIRMPTGSFPVTTMAPAMSSFATWSQAPHDS